MTDLSLPNVFTNDTTADANEVNANFNAIETIINTTGVPKVQDGIITPAKLSFDPATQTELDAHVNDTSAAHAASSISANSGTLAGVGTDVQAVLEELDDAITAVAAGGISAGSVDSTKLADHSVTPAKLAVPEVSTTVSGSISAPSIAANGNATIYFHVDASTGANTSYGSGTYLTWDSTNHRFKAVSAGLFRLDVNFMAKLVPTVSGTSELDVYVLKNGNIGVGTALASNTIYRVATSGTTQMNMFHRSYVLSLAANDYIIIGAKMTLSAGATASQFSINDDGTASSAYGASQSLTYLGPAS